MRLTPALILEVMHKFASQGVLEVASSQLLVGTGGSIATLKRHLDKMVRASQLHREGVGRATRYRLPQQIVQPAHTVGSETSVETAGSIPWPGSGQAVLEAVTRPLAARTPVTYQRKFVDEYIPNESSLLPRDLAITLANEGRMLGQQPAATYARKVLEQLLLDLSWSSSRLEGNRYSLLATEELFRSGAQDGDSDAVMLLNHKRAIEFMVDAVPEYGLTGPVVRNLHALLMQDLLPDSDALGAIRTKVVNITDTVYLPTQVPSLLEEMFNAVIERARLIKNPIEGAFFLWLNFAYLQPFDDGNKRTSRLAANIPLMLYNCAPLSFLDVDHQDYAHAMLGVYELLDVSLATELFVRTYRRSVKKYAVVMEAVGAPDGFRVRHREHLNDAIQRVVREGQSALEATTALTLPREDVEPFTRMLMDELSKLTSYNCARFRLTMKTVEDWVKSGRRY
jgi:Fic family protein